MSTRSSTPPKRRASTRQSPQPPKTSRMSASAPTFHPSKPLPSPSKHPTDTDSYDPESSIAASRVTRPLPNSRRPGAAANYVPKPATVPKTGEAKETTRRLIVVLAQVRLSLLLMETDADVYRLLGMFGSVQSLVRVRREERRGQRSQVRLAQLR